jgi:hypothetical protein
VRPGTDKDHYGLTHMGLDALQLGVMNRSIRSIPIAVVVLALALVLLVAGSALANKGFRAERQPDVVAQDEEEGVPSQEVLDKVVDRLDAAGIDATAEEVAELAATYGVGGAVRILAWGAATDADVAGMFDSGLGWGEIARQLNEADAEGDLNLHPGIGWVMGGGQGQGKANAPGQAKKQQ